MDVVGRKPSTEEGAYFRNNVWWWHPLAAYVRRVAPAITGKCRYWDLNENDGLDADDAIRLADALQKEIDSGRTESYAMLYCSKLGQMPKKECRLCAGTGTRKPPPRADLLEDPAKGLVTLFGSDVEADGAGDPTTTGIVCNSCGGEGYVEAWATHYPFSVDNVKRFVTFLRGCGGFVIW